jgi:crotonobetainyl-CoA:carnitine CoA-transferase CaiB-like acyl-CoA transferase
MAMNGSPDGPPARLPVALIDLLAAHQLKEGLLLALLQRERSGRGRIVECSLWSAALTSLANQGTNFLMAGYDPERTGTEHPNLFPYGTLLPCRDGEILLAVGTDRQFQDLCAVLGDGALAAAYPSNAERVSSRDVLRPQLESLARRYGAAELLDRLARAGVPSGRLQSVGQALQSRQGQDLQLHADALAGLRSVGFHGFGPRHDLLPPPRLGEHGPDLDWRTS